MPSNLVPSAEEPQPEPVAAVAAVTVPSGAGLVTCEACGSRITRATGEMYDVGDRIKKARKSEERIESLESEIARLTRELGVANDALAELKRKHEPQASERPKAGW